MLLNDIARNAANARNIEQHRDDMMRMACFLTLGTIRASVLIRSLLSSDCPSGLKRPIIEAGKINKSLYLMNYIDDEGCLRRILTQLNRAERRDQKALSGWLGGATGRSGAGDRCRRALEFYFYAGRTGRFA